MRVMVAGGDIGGLTVAIALRRVGAEVVVFERARRMRAVGTGPLLAANALEALRKIGLANQIREIGVPGTSGDLLSRSTRRGYEHLACASRDDPFTAISAPRIPRFGNAATPGFPVQG